MTKTELIGKMASSAKVSKASAGKALDAFIDGVKESLKKEEKVTLVGFGTFSVSVRQARKGRNPRTGNEIQIPARKVPKFTAGKSFKEEI